MLYLVFDRWSKAGARRPYFLNGREEMVSPEYVPVRMVLRDVAGGENLKKLVSSQEPSKM
jgi:hypothetical protein